MTDMLHVQRSILEHFLLFEYNCNMKEREILIKKKMRIRLWRVYGLYLHITTLLRQGENLSQFYMISILLQTSYFIHIFIYWYIYIYLRKRGVCKSRLLFVLPLQGLAHILVWNLVIASTESQQDLLIISLGFIL